MNTIITFTSNLELLGYLLTNPNMVIDTKCNGNETLFRVTKGVLQYSEELKVNKRSTLHWASTHFSYFDQWEFPQNHIVKLHKS